MIAVHLSPGPRGYGVERDDGTLIATGMTYQQALLTVNEGRELDPKYTGNRPFSTVYRDGRNRRLNYSHNQAQSRDDFYTP